MKNVQSRQNLVQGRFEKNSGNAMRINELRENESAGIDRRHEQLERLT